MNGTQSFARERIAARSGQSLQNWQVSPPFPQITLKSSEKTVATKEERNIQTSAACRISRLPSELTQHSRQHGYQARQSVVAVCRSMTVALPHENCYRRGSLPHLRCYRAGDV